jgi:protocatechuate 4,5-dioxygenase beta chain
LAEIVAAFGLPHTPSLPALVAREGPTSETAQLFARVQHDLEAVQPDALVIFDSDHLNTFFLDNLPLLSVGVASSTAGPNDGTPAMPRYQIPVHEELAQHVRGYGIGHGFDLGVTQEFEVDHSVLVPLHFVTPRMDVPIVPVFIAAIVPPIPQARRCFALGQTVRGAIEALPRATRVAVLASGSISLDIGSPLAPPGQIAGTADIGWLREVLGYLKNGAVDDLLNAATTERLARAGNIGGELLNWIALLGGIGTRRPSFLEAQEGHGDAFAVWRWDA